MNDPVVQQLMLVLNSHGQSVLDDRPRLEGLLMQACGAYPGKVKALLTLLDKNAVKFLAGWASDTRPDKLDFDQVRQSMAMKFSQANLLNAQAASWAVEAWVAALRLRAPQPGKSGAGERAQSHAGSAAAPPGPVPVPPRSPALIPGLAAQAEAGAPNVYAPPIARVDDPTAPAEEDGNFVPAARAVSAGRGWQWFVGGWNLFKPYPGLWIVNVVLLVVIGFVLGLFPIIGGIAATLLNAVFMGGLMIGADAQRRGEPFEVVHLFAGFKQRTGTLMVVGLLYLVGIILVLGIVFGILGFGMFTAIQGGDMATVMQTVPLVALVALALFTPVFMAYLYAPALVALNGMGAVAAMKASFLGCIKNIVPGLIYSLVFFGLAIVASLPILLGWLVLGPVVVASVYASYRDVFFEE